MDRLADSLALTELLDPQRDQISRDADLAGSPARDGSRLHLPVARRRSIHDDIAEILSFDLDDAEERRGEVEEGLQDRIALGPGHFGELPLGHFLVRDHDARRSVPS